MINSREVFGYFDAIRAENNEKLYHRGAQSSQRKYMKYLKIFTAEVAENSEKTNSIIVKQKIF